MATAPVSTRSPSSPGHSGRIDALIVDRQALAREGLRAMLRGSRVQLTADTEDAEDALRITRRQPPDIVLMDTRSTGALGFNSIELIREASPGTAVLMLSGRRSADEVRQCLRAGAAGYLAKDFTPDTLLRAVEAVMAGGTVIDPQALTEFVQTLSAPEVGSTAAERARISRLTTRDRAMLRALARGRSNREIAAMLNFTVGTVKNRVAEIYRKLDVADRVEAVYFATRCGIVK